MSIHRGFARTAYRALRGRNRYAADLPLFSQLRLLRQGMLPVSGLLYDHDDLKHYLSDLERFTRGAAINGRNAFLLNDKLAFHQMISAHDRSLVPVTLAVVRAGAVLPAGADGPEDLEQLRVAMSSLGRTVVKPNDDGGGHGVYRVTSDDSGWSMNDKRTDWDGVVEVLRGLRAALVSAYVQQAPYADRIYPGSTNSIRILTIRPEGGDAFIARAVHRFGSDGTGPVDNWAKGGLSCPINLDTGTLGPGVTHPGASSQRVHNSHPDTGAQITGVEVERWLEVMQRVLALARKVPPDYIGWDVVVTARGPVLLEGNSNSGVGLFQAHGPLLTDPRVRHFYVDRGVVRR